MPTVLLAQRITEELLESAGSTEVLAALFLALLLIYPLTCVHELGHAVCGKLGGFLVTSCGVGVSRPFWVFRAGGVRFYLAKGQALQGITFALSPRLLPPRGPMMLFLSGGILAHAALVLLTLPLLWLAPWGAVLWWPLLGLNVLFFFVNLIPITIRAGAGTFRSDGGQMLLTLRDGGIPRSPRDYVLLAAALRGLFADLGDPLSLRVYLLNQATSWLDLGAPAAARQALEEAEQAGDPPPWVRASGLQVRGGVLAAEGRLDEAEQAFVEAEALFTSQGHAVGLFLARLRRVGLLRARGEAAAALALLDEVSADPVVKARPYLLLDMCTTRLCIRTTQADADLDALDEEYRAMRRRDPSDARDLRFYRALAAAAEARGDAELADKALAGARSAAKRLEKGWLDAPTREAFRAAQADLFPDAEKQLEPPPDPAEQRRAAQVRRNRWHHNAGVALAVVTVVTFWLVVPRPEPGNRDRIPEYVGWLVALSFGFFALVYYLLARLFGLKVPLLKRRGGSVTWLLVLLGWVLGVVIWFALDRKLLNRDEAQRPAVNVRSAHRR
jgi:tetratricopeptide (TPR) repeat protein